MNEDSKADPAETPTQQEIAARFGLLPNFFRLAPQSPQIAENLWGYAKFGYLDNPLPSLFKERLFVFLSRFCDVRYCIGRHVGFLVGLGQASGDAETSPQTADQVVKLIQRPFPRGDALIPHLTLLQELQVPLSSVPKSGTVTEEAIFACAAHVFLQTPQAALCLEILGRTFGEPLFQNVLVFLSFVHTAHFWTKLHPELSLEEDIISLFDVQQTLAECVLNDPEGKTCEITETILHEVEALRREKEHAELLRVTLASIGDAVISTDIAGRVTNINPVAARLTGWPVSDAIGQFFELVFRMEDEATHQPLANPAERVLRDGITTPLTNHTVLKTRDGLETPIEHSATPIRSQDGSIIGCVLVFRDVSERLKTERALQQSEARKTAMFENALDCILTIDHQGRIMEFNRAAERTFGHAHEQAIGQDLVELLLSPAHREQYRDALTSNLTSGEEPVLNKRLELPAMRADGTEICVDIAFARISAASSPVFAAYLRDVTESKVTEAALRDSEQRYRLVSQVANDAIWNWNLLTDEVIWNEGLEIRFGHSAAQVEHDGKWWIAQIHPDDRQYVSDGIHAVIDNGGSIWQDEYRYCRADGSYADVFDRGRVVRDATGKAIRMVGAMLDLTERKRAQNIIRASEERIRFALDAAELGSWHVDPHTMVLTTDERFRAIFEIEGNDRDVNLVIEHIHPDDRERVVLAIANATRPDDPEPYAEEYRVLLADGTTRWVFAKGGSAMEEIDGVKRVISFDGTIADITEQRRVREELRALAARLSEADRRKDEFLATLAHELRNPLAPIRTGLEMMKLAKNDPAIMEDIRSTMERQTQQMVHLIDDLLDVSRITQGKFELRKSCVTLKDIVQSAVEATQPFIDEMNHKLTISLPDESVFLEADLNRLAQVLSNLIHNAAKYTPTGGHIWLTAENVDPIDIKISIKDNGIGIPAELQSSIFDMFTQIDHPLEKGYKGLGIGLTLVKRLVEMHNGQVMVHSAGADQGTEFAISLPRLADGHTAAGQLHLPEESMPSGLRILVVDDNIDAANTLRSLIELLGNEVQAAYDGRLAVHLAAAFRPQVILMDIGMPLMNGYEAAQQIRKEAWGQKVVLVALTGWGQAGDKIRASNAGFNHHLVKPADLADIKRLFTQLEVEPDIVLESELNVGQSAPESF